MRHAPALQSIDGARCGITLLEMDPDLSPLLTSEERAAAERFLLPVRTFQKNADLSEAIAESGAFGAVVCHGLVLQTVQIGSHQALNLIGPGALLPVGHQADWMPHCVPSVRAAHQTRVALLDAAFLSASREWPWVVVRLHERMLEQLARLTRQLAISQLPRVEDRVVGALRLLAESWGRVTPAGIRLQLPLTHEAVGRLIGARRPTVSIALRALAERNVVVKHDEYWLIAPEPES